MHFEILITLSCICNKNFTKSFKSDLIKSVKHQEKLGKYYCRKCNLYMPLLDKDSHLESDNHKNKTSELWCED